MRPPKKQRPAGEGGPSKISKSFGELIEGPAYDTAKSVSRVATGSLQIGEIEYIGVDVWAARGIDNSELGFHHTFADAHSAVWRAYLRTFTGAPDSSGHTH
ncbi:hypothetical protein HNQ36_001040 [Afipia massiliensis]|uniref:Uncharacterized protein n=1 Tax=Afipia massiliensis TaxID=211460 RepID=A0A840N2Y3_9BRAD|nr:hypothetical protein [Afipia massiliensis]MBB5051086.1 hypothetical protein [Afipia massiliensis]